MVVIVSGGKPDGVTLASHRAGATEQRLIRRLLRDYDVDARGVRKLNSTVTVTIQLLLLRIQGLVSNGRQSRLIISHLISSRLIYNLT